MDLSTSRLRVVVAVAESGSFSAAARRLHLAQPSVSRAVSDFERQVGARVFERGTHRVWVTDEGRSILEECRRLLAATDEFSARVERASSGELAHFDVLAMHSLAALVLPRALREFSLAHPYVGLTVSDHFAGEIYDSIRDDERKIALTAMPPNFTGFRPEEELVYTELIRDEFVLIRSSATAADAEVSWDEIGGMDLILAAPESNTGRYTAHILESHGLEPHVVARLRNISSVGGMVTAGVGAAIVPRMSLPLMAFGEVTITPLPTAHSRGIGVIQSQKVVSSPVRDALVQGITRECRRYAGE